MTVRDSYDPYVLQRRVYLEFKVTPITCSFVYVCIKSPILKVFRLISSHFPISHCRPLATIFPTSSFRSHSLIETSVLNFLLFFYSENDRNLFCTSSFHTLFRDPYPILSSTYLKDPVVSTSKEVQLEVRVSVGGGRKGKSLKFVRRTLIRFTKDDGLGVCVCLLVNTST